LLSINMSLRRFVPVFLLAIISVAVLSFKTIAATTSTSLSSVQCLVGPAAPLGNCILQAIPIGLIGIGISLMFTALVYMSGEVLHYDALKGFFKREIWETIKSAIILAAIFSVLIIASGVAYALVGAAPASSTTSTTCTAATTGSSTLTNNLAGLYFAACNSYLQPQLSNAITSFGGIIGFSEGTALLSSIELKFFVPLFLPLPEISAAIQSGFIANPFVSSIFTPLSYSAFPPLTSLLNLSADTEITVLLLLQVQSDLLYYVAILGLAVLIPVGLIMRAFPFMRGIGGSLIAMGIGLSIVYPALLVGFNLPVTNYMIQINNPTVISGGTQAPCFLSQTSTPTSGGGATPPVSTKKICGVFESLNKFITTLTGTFAGTFPLTLGFGKSGFSSSSATIAGYGFETGLLGPWGNVPGNPDNGIYPAFNFIIADIFPQLIQFLLFILDLIIGYAITSGIAGLMGGKITLGIGSFRLA
jgi:hypothetical protein